MSNHKITTISESSIEEARQIILQSPSTQMHWALVNAIVEVIEKYKLEIEKNQELYEENISIWQRKYSNQTIKLRMARAALEVLRQIREWWQ